MRMRRMFFSFYNKQFNSWKMFKQTTNKHDIQFININSFFLIPVVSNICVYVILKLRKMLFKCVFKKQNEKKRYFRCVNNKLVDF